MFVIYPWLQFISSEKEKKINGKRISHDFNGSKTLFILWFKSLWFSATLYFEECCKVFDYFLWRCIKVWFLNLIFRDYLALNVYVALCYYKLDYYDVSQVGIWTEFIMMTKIFTVFMANSLLFTWESYIFLCKINPSAFYSQLCFFFSMNFIPV